MSPEDPTLALPASGDVARQLRDRLLAALLVERGDKGLRLVLYAYHPEVALLIAEDASVRVLLLTADPAATPEALRNWFTDLTKRTDAPGSVLHTVAVGGGAEVAQALKQAMPKSHIPGFYHLASSGDFAALGVHELPLLRAASARRDIEALTPEQLAAAIAEGQVLQRATQNLPAGLKGSYRVTATIMVVCCVLMALQLYWTGASKLAVFAAMGANSGLALQDGEVWRLFASAFLHGDIIHLLVNMLALWSFGLLLESLLGPRRYLLLYGLSALGGSLASAFLGTGAWSVGASGAIWGLMAAGIGIAYWPRDLFPPAMLTRLRKGIWMPLVLNLAYSFQPGVDLFAHLGGGVVGLALITGLLTRDLKPVAERTHPADAERGPRPGLTLGAVVLAVVMALSIVVALATGRPWALDEPLVFQRTAIGDTGFSVELPGRIAADLKIEESDGVRMYGFGKILETSVAFEFLVVPLPYELRPADVEPLLEQERQALDQVTPPDFTRQGPAERVTVGGRPAVRVDYKLNELSLRTYVVPFTHHEVLIRRYILGELPPIWLGAEETVLASLGTPSDTNADTRTPAP